MSGGLRDGSVSGEDRPVGISVGALDGHPPPPGLLSSHSCSVSLSAWSVCFILFSPVLCAQTKMCLYEVWSLLLHWWCTVGLPVGLDF